MADEGNNGGYGESDFKRKVDQKKECLQESDDDEEGCDKKPINDYYIKELLSERVHIDGNGFPHADRLLEHEIHNAKQNGRLAGKETRYVDIYLEKPIKVVVKVIIPVKEHPRFNFVGKLLGPKGNSMRRLQEETMCKMAVMGRGSMKDRAREESLRQGLDPKYAHLNDELHVEISALAPPSEAHARIAFALAEVRKYLIPDSNDDIRQEQFRELVAGASPMDDFEKEDYYNSRPPTYSTTKPHHNPRAQPSPIIRSRSPSRVAVKAPKQRVLSILERARSVANAGRYPSDSEADYFSYDRRPYIPEMEHHHPLPPRSRTAARPAEPNSQYRRDYYRDDAPYVKHSAPGHPHHASSSWRSTTAAYQYPDEAYAAPPRLRAHHHAERSYRGSPPYLRPK